MTGTITIRTGAAGQDGPSAPAARIVTQEGANLGLRPNQTQQLQATPGNVVVVTILRDVSVTVSHDSGNPVTVSEIPPGEGPAKPKRKVAKDESHRYRGKNTVLKVAVGSPIERRGAVRGDPRRPPGR